MAERDIEAENKKLRRALDRVTTWLDRLAIEAEKRARDTRFQTLADANAKDAKNYRATAADLRSAMVEVWKDGA